jgi:hypothetical protein
MLYLLGGGGSLRPQGGQPWGARLRRILVITDKGPVL